ncbi:MAG: FlxA-like family protein [Planctomycetia bacterium]|nr:FlxA-like family protein [Planctomycetia bacterium]
MPETQLTHKGPWTHRFLVHLFTVVLTVLVYWLLGFIVDDIGSWPGPQYTDVEQRLLDQTLVAKSQELHTTIADIERRVSNQKSRQSILGDSTASSQKTMNQLLEIQRLALQKDVTPTPEEAKALADSEELFLSNQKQYQLLNAEIADLNAQLQDVEQQRRDLDKTLEGQREPIRREYEALLRVHDLRMAAIKLGALVPLLVVALILFLKRRGSLYAPLVYAFGIALMLKVALVMHEYFPSRYFKYILIVICLIVVTRMLVSLLRMIAFPKRDWLLKQYREAYEVFLCPVCDYPIRRGPLKYLFWTRRTIKKLHVPHDPSLPGSASDESYTCPMCGTKLFEECPSCHANRHSLLPACEKCGAEKVVAPSQVVRH